MASSSDPSPSIPLPTRESTLLSSLAGTPYACKTLTSLSGGSCNWTYLGHLLTPLPTGEESIIVKHAEDTIAVNKNFKFDVIRSFFEQATLAALSQLPPFQSAKILITTPTLHAYLPETHTLLLTSLPSSIDLKSHLLAHPLSSPNGYALGQALGTWTRAFHNWGRANEQADLRKTLTENKPALDLKMNINAGRLVGTVERFPGVLEQARELFKRVEVGMREKGERKNREGMMGVIHGDFWTGNILLPNHPLTSLSLTTPTPSPPLKLFIIDWELSHCGPTMNDLGQCLAELFLLLHFRSITAVTAIIDGFLQAYGLVDKEEACEVAVHFGIHLVVWPCRIPGWGSQEMVEKCVEIGRDFVRAGWEGDEGWLGTGVLGGLFDKGERTEEMG